MLVVEGLVFVVFERRGSLGDNRSTGHPGHHAAMQEFILFRKFGLRSKVKKRYGNIVKPDITQND